MNRAMLILAAALVCPAGCLKTALKTPAEDHRVQAEVIAESCEVDGYGAGKCTKADLDAMREQACLIDVIVKGKGRDASECEGADSE